MAIPDTPFPNYLIPGREETLRGEVQILPELSNILYSDENHHSLNIDDNDHFEKIRNAYDRTYKLEYRKVDQEITNCTRLSKVAFIVGTVVLSTLLTSIALTAGFTALSIAGMVAVASPVLFLTGKFFDFFDQNILYKIKNRDQFLQQQISLRFFLRHDSCVAQEYQNIPDPTQRERFNVIPALLQNDDDTKLNREKGLLRIKYAEMFFKDWDTAFKKDQLSQLRTGFIYSTIISSVALAVGLFVISEIALFFIPLVLVGVATLNFLANISSAYSKKYASQLGYFDITSNICNRRHFWMIGLLNQQKKEEIASRPILNSLLKDTIFPQVITKIANEYLTEFSENIDLRRVDYYLRDRRTDGHQMANRFYLDLIPDLIKHAILDPEQKEELMQELIKKCESEEEKLHLRVCKKRFLIHLAAIASLVASTIMTFLCFLPLASLPLAVGIPLFIGIAMIFSLIPISILSLSIQRSNKTRMLSLPTLVSHEWVAERHKKELEGTYLERNYFARMLTDHFLVTQNDGFARDIMPDPLKYNGASGHKIIERIGFIKRFYKEEERQELSIQWTKRFSVVFLLVPGIMTVTIAIATIALIIIGLVHPIFLGLCIAFMISSTAIKVGHMLLKRNETKLLERLTAFNQLHTKAGAEELLTRM